ncbi:uncharacterized protein LOC121880414 [Homarus americanus]|uniref:uncharacterized protein LOC121880414 n=1 Tax=Homarus americanus TaxID=6706 RepID=UPI001C465898|nr:uncharacterized protein LOC121880414 [Homarus americanus]
MERMVDHLGSTINTPQLFEDDDSPESLDVGSLLSDSHGRGSETESCFSGFDSPDEIFLQKCHERKKKIQATLVNKITKHGRLVNDEKKNRSVTNAHFILCEKSPDVDHRDNRKGYMTKQNKKKKGIAKIIITYCSNENRKCNSFKSLNGGIQVVDNEGRGYYQIRTNTSTENMKTSSRGSQVLCHNINLTQKHNQCKGTHPVLLTHSGHFPTTKVQTNNDHLTYNFPVNELKKGGMTVYTNVPPQYGNVPKKNLSPQNRNAPMEDLSPQNRNAPMEDISPQNRNAPLEDISPQNRNAPMEDLSPQNRNAPREDLSPQNRNAPLEDLSPQNRNAPREDLSPQNRNTPMEDLSPQNRNAPMENLCPQNMNAPMEDLSPQNRNAPMEDLSPENRNAPMEDLSPQNRNAPMEDISPQNRNAPMEDLSPQNRNAPMEDLSPQNRNAPMEDLSPQNRNAPMEDISPQNRNAPMEDLFPENRNAPLEDLFPETRNAPLEDLSPQNRNAHLEDLTPENRNAPLEDLSPQNRNAHLEDLTPENRNAPMEDLSPQNRNAHLEDLTPENINAPMEDLSPENRNAPMEDLFPENRNAPMEDLSPQNRNAHLEDLTPENRNAPMEDLSPENRNAPMEDLFPENRNAPLEDLFPENRNAPLEDLTPQNRNAPMEDLSPQNKNAPMEDLSLQNMNALMETLSPTPIITDPDEPAPSYCASEQIREVPATEDDVMNDSGHFIKDKDNIMDHTNNTCPNTEDINHSLVTQTSNDTKKMYTVYNSVNMMEEIGAIKENKTDDTECEDVCTMNLPTSNNSTNCSLGVKETKEKHSDSINDMNKKYLTEESVSNRKAREPCHNSPEKLIDIVKTLSNVSSSQTGNELPFLENLVNQIWHELTVQTQATENAGDTSNINSILSDSPDNKIILSAQNLHQEVYEIMIQESNEIIGNSGNSNTVTSDTQRPHMTSSSKDINQECYKKPNLGLESEEDAGDIVSSVSDMYDLQGRMSVSPSNGLKGEYEELTSTQNSMAGTGDAVTTNSDPPYPQGKMEITLMDRYYIENCETMSSVPKCADSVDSINPSCNLSHSQSTNVISSPRKLDPGSSEGLNSSNKFVKETCHGTSSRYNLSKSQYRKVESATIPNEEFYEEVNFKQNITRTYSKANSKTLGKKFKSSSQKLDKDTDNKAARKEKYKEVSSADITTFHKITKESRRPLSLPEETSQENFIGNSLRNSCEQSQGKDVDGDIIKRAWHSISSLPSNYISEFRPFSGACSRNKRYDKKLSSMNNVQAIPNDIEVLSIDHKYFSHDNTFQNSSADKSNIDSGVDSFTTNNFTPCHNAQKHSESTDHSNDSDIISKSFIRYKCQEKPFEVSKMLGTIRSSAVDKNNTKIAQDYLGCCTESSQCTTFNDKVNRSGTESILYPFDRTTFFNSIGLVGKNVHNNKRCSPSSVAHRTRKVRARKEREHTRKEVMLETPKFNPTQDKINTKSSVSKENSMTVVNDFSYKSIKMSCCYKDEECQPNVKEFTNLGQKKKKSRSGQRKLLFKSLKEGRDEASLAVCDSSKDGSVACCHSRQDSLESCHKDDNGNPNNICGKRESQCVIEKQNEGLKKSGDSTCFKNTTEKSVVEDKTNTTLCQENYSSCLRSNTSIKHFICNTCRKSFQSTDQLNFHCTTECAHSLTCGTHNCSQCSHPSHQSSSTSVIETNMRNSSSKHVTKFTNNICHSPGISLYKQPLKVQDFTITQKINTFPNPPDIVVTHLHVHQNSLQAKVLGRASVEKLCLCEEGKGEDPEEPFRYVAYNVQNPEQPVRFVVDNREDPGQVFNFGSDNGEDPAQPFGFGSGIGEDPAQPFGFGSGIGEDPVQPFGFGSDIEEDPAQPFGFGSDIGEDPVQPFGSVSDIEEDPVQPFGSGSDNGEDQQELFSFGLDSGQPFSSRADYIRTISSEKMVEKFLDPSKKLLCDSSKTEEKISFAPQKVLKHLSEENDFLGFEDGVQDYEVNENFFPSIILNKKSCIRSANEEKNYLCLQNIEEDNCENTTTIDPEHKCMESLVEGPSCNKSNIPLLIPSAELVLSMDNSTLPVSSDLDASGDLQTLNDVSFAPPRKSKRIVRRRAKRLLDQNTSKLLLTSGVKKKASGVTGSHAQQPLENALNGQVQENTSQKKKYPGRAVIRQSIEVNKSRELYLAVTVDCQPSASNTAKQYEHRNLKFIRSVVCSICSQYCYSTGDLVQHMKTHAFCRLFKCPLCPLICTTKAFLTEHLVLHNGKKHFVCFICKAVFSHKYELKAHTSIFMGEKPFRCSECGKMFSLCCQLGEHKFTHTSERPFKCDLFPGDFKSYANLLNNRRIHLEDQ